MSSFPAFCSLLGLDLEPFQRKIATAAGGPERELAVLLPRGNGKTSLVAAYALHRLITGPGHVYAAAASREQARILYEYAAQYARTLADENIVDRHLELRWCPDPRYPRVFTRHLRVLAADAPRLHGLTYGLAIVDELHAHPNDQVYLALLTALAKQPGAKMITISSAGQGADSPLGRLRARGMAQPTVTRRGYLTDARGPGLRMLEWAVPQDVDLTPRTVKRANPASWVRLEDLRAQQEAVPDLAFRRFHAGQWTERASYWLPPGAWQRCVGDPQIPPGAEIYLGVDVGGQRSATAVAWVTPEKTADTMSGVSQLHTGVWIGHGDEAVIEARDLIRELGQRHRIVEVSFDPWRAGQLAAELEQEGVPCAAFPQSDARMIPASSRLHAAIVEQRLTIPASEELTQHAANTVAKHSRRGWRIDKPDDRTPNDAIIALAMAVDSAENRPEPVRLLGWL
jgi:phage terminase large subunit-like protein